MGFCVCLKVYRGLLWAYLPVTWIQLSTPSEFCSPLLHKKQYHSFLQITLPIELTQRGLFTRPFRAPRASRISSTIMHFTVPNLCSVQQPQTCWRQQQVISDSVEEKKAPSSSKHYDYDYCCFCKKIVPTWGSTHIQPLCGMFSIKRLLLWLHEEKKQRRWSQI